MRQLQAAGLARCIAFASVCASLIGCDAAISEGGRRPNDGSGAGGTSSANSGGAGGAGPGAVILPDGTVATLIPTRVRRLTNAEYDYSVASLLGTSQTPAKSFATDARQAGYTPNANQRVDPVLADQLQTAATTLATEAVTQRLDTLVPCAASADEACAVEFITSFGKKAYRRPLTDTEIGALTTVYRAGVEGAAFRNGIELVIRAVLQAPGFLYVTELGDSMPGQTGTATLTQHEIASAIAYVVTGAPPDTTLLEAADRGELTDGASRGAIATHLINDRYETRYQFRRFVREWLGIDQLDNIAKSPLSAGGQDFTTLRPSMQLETDSFIDHVMRNDGASLRNLLSAEYTVADQGIATFYGLNGAPATGTAELPLGSLPRRGILTQASFLAAHSHELETGPIMRGVAVLRRVLCVDMPRPVSLNIEIVPPAPDPTLTTRERFLEHTVNEDCQHCHNVIDPIGFAFEHYSALGEYQTTENGKDIDSTGSLLAGSDVDGPFDDALGLVAKLSQSNKARECYARQMYRFASAQDDKLTEDSFIQFWKQAPETVQDSLIELVKAYVQSELFIKRSIQ